MTISGSAGEVGLLLSRASRQWAGILAGHLGRLGITPGQTPILVVLLTEEPMVWTESTLATAVGQAQQTVSTHVARLERDGLVQRTRVRSPKGRLAYRVTVSEAGADRRHEFLQALSRAEAELVAELSADDRVEMADSLRRLARRPLVPTQAGEVKTATS